MALYFCTCNDENVDHKSVTIKLVKGQIRADVICKSCGDFMEMRHPKSGCAGFTSNKYGQL